MTNDKHDLIARLRKQTQAIQARHKRLSGRNMAKRPSVNKTPPATPQDVTDDIALDASFSQLFGRHWQLTGTHHPFACVAGVTPN